MASGERNRWLHRGLDIKRTLMKIEGIDLEA
jgi:hypothetical protein